MSKWFQPFLLRSSREQWAQSWGALRSPKRPIENLAVQWNGANQRVGLLVAIHRKRRSRFEQGYNRVVECPGKSKECRSLYQTPMRLIIQAKIDNAFEQIFIFNANAVSRFSKVFTKG